MDNKKEQIKKELKSASQQRVAIILCLSAITKTKLVSDSGNITVCLICMQCYYAQVSETC